MKNVALFFFLICSFLYGMEDAKNSCKEIPNKTDSKNVKELLVNKIKFNSGLEFLFSNNGKDLIFTLNYLSSCGFLKDENTKNLKCEIFEIKNLNKNYTLVLEDFKFFFPNSEDMKSFGISFLDGKVKTVAKVGINLESNQLIFATSEDLLSFLSLNNGLPTHVERESRCSFIYKKLPELKFENNNQMLSFIWLNFKSDNENK